MNKPQREKFPFPPVKEVAFEVNFDSRLKIDKEISDYQDKIIKDLPKFTWEHSLKSVPEIAVPELVRQMGTRVYVFENEQRSEILRISCSNFNYITKGYVSFDDFKRKLKNYFEKFCELYQIEIFKRIGLRYINNIEIKKVNGFYDFTKYIVPFIALNHFPINDIITTFAEVRLNKSDKKLTIRSGLIGEATRREDSQKVGIYILDFDCFNDIESKREDFDKVIVDFHDLIEDEFLASVTKEFKEYMRTGKLL